MLEAVFFSDPKNDNFNCVIWFIVKCNFPRNNKAIEAFNNDHIDCGLEL